MEGYITTREAARIIGCVERQVRQLLQKKVLEGERAGRDWIVLKTSAETYAANRPKPGPKPKTEPPKRPSRPKKKENPT